MKKYITPEFDLIKELEDNICYDVVVDASEMDYLELDSLEDELED